MLGCIRGKAGDEGKIEGGIVDIAKVDFGRSQSPRMANEGRDESRDMTMNWKLIRIEELLNQKSHVPLNEIAQEVGGDSERNVKRLIHDLKTKAGRKISWSGEGYFWAERPLLPLLVNLDVAGDYENDLIFGAALREPLALTIVLKGSHRLLKVVPIKVERQFSRRIMRGVTIPDQAAVSIPMDQWTLCDAERYLGDWESLLRRKEVLGD